MANKFFPVSINLNNKNILVIGAGKIALRKVETLMSYNCNIVVITKDILEEKFLELEKNNKIKIVIGNKIIKYSFEIFIKKEKINIKIYIFLDNLFKSNNDINIKATIP